MFWVILAVGLFVAFWVFVGEWRKWRDRGDLQLQADFDREMANIRRREWYREHGATWYPHVNKDGTIGTFTIRSRRDTPSCG